MPETFRESGDPEAAAVFEEGGERRVGGRGVRRGCNGLHMSPSPLELARHDSPGHFHLWVLLSLIITRPMLEQQWQYGGGEGGWWWWGAEGCPTFHVVFSLLQNGFQKRTSVVQIAPISF